MNRKQYGYNENMRLNDMLLSAVSEGDIAWAKRLLRSGVDADARAREGYYTPMHIAAWKGDGEMVAMLLTHGASVDAVSIPEGQSPLHLAVYQGHKEIVDTLIQHGAYVDRPNHKQLTPLQIAGDRGHQEIMEVLEAKGAHRIPGDPYIKDFHKVVITLPTDLDAGLSPKRNDRPLSRV
jgi:ankyrin repeat protein